VGYAKKSSALKSRKRSAASRKPAKKRKASSPKPRKRSTATPKPARKRAPKPKRSCKYGPRGADGYCPKKPSAYSTRSPSAAATADAPTTTVGRIRAEVGKELESAAKTQAKSLASKAVTAAAPFIAKNALAIGKASLVGLAGVAAYELTKKLMTLRWKTYADLRFDLANQYRHARQNVPRALTAAELASFKQWYDAKSAEIDAAERGGRGLVGIQNLIFGD